MATMAKRPMTLDLFATLDIIDDDVSAVMDAYLADPTARMVAFAEGYRINPATAVASHPFACTLMDQPWADDALRRAARRLYSRTGLNDKKRNLYNTLRRLRAAFSLGMGQCAV